MKKMQSIVLALSLVLVAPMAAQAAEITLVPSVKLQIGDRDNRGYYWDGGHWRDHGWWKQHYEWRGNRWHPYGPLNDKCRVTIRHSAPDATLARLIRPT